MNDSLFDMPVTIKVRSFPAWNKVSAMQSGREIPVSIVEHEGEHYLLLPVVPDRGEVVIKDKSN